MRRSLLGVVTAFTLFAGTGCVLMPLMMVGMGGMVAGHGKQGNHGGTGTAQADTQDGTVEHDMAGGHEGDGDQNEAAL